MYRITDNQPSIPPCVLNDLGNCLALRAEACMCTQMPDTIYNARRDEIMKRRSERDVEGGKRTND